MLDRPIPYSRWKGKLLGKLLENSRSFAEVFEKFPENQSRYKDDAPASAQPNTHKLPHSSHAPEVTCGPRPRASKGKPTWSSSPASRPS